MITFYYQKYHFLTKKHHIVSVEYDPLDPQSDPDAFIKRVAKWNAMNPKVYQYWTNVTNPQSDPRWLYKNITEIDKNIWRVEKQ